MISIKCVYADLRETPKRCASCDMLSQSAGGISSTCNHDNTHMALGMILAMHIRREIQCCGRVWLPTWNSQSAVGEKPLNLTLNVRGMSYLGLTSSISWLLMPWYWLCRIGRFLSYLRKDFNYLRRINVEMTQNINICLYSLWKILYIKG